MSLPRPPPHAAPINLSDRAHFRATMATGDFTAGAYIVSRSTDAPAFPFALAFRDASGAIAGTVIAAIELSAFDSLFDRWGLPENSVLGITDSQGVRLYFRPKKETNTLGAFHSSGGLAGHQPGRRHGPDPDARFR